MRENPSCDKTRSQTEKEFLEDTWSFLNVLETTHIPKDMVGDYLLVLLQPGSTAELVENLEKLDRTIQDQICQRRNPSPPLEKLVRNFKKLSENMLAYQQTKGQTSKRFQSMQEELKKPYTFKPQINQKSDLLQSGSSAPLKRHEVLYKKHKQFENKIVSQRIQRLEQEVSACTFKPSINKRKAATPSVKTPEPQESVTTQDKELEKCTFRPNLNSTFKFRSAASIPKGYEESVQRLRQANHEKELRKKEIEHIPTGENYEKLRNSKIKPFSFLERQKQHKNVLMYVDVNVGPGKTGRIAIHEGDKPKVLAKNFCKAYSLNSEMEAMLEEMLISQIESINK